MSVPLSYLARLDPTVKCSIINIRSLRRLHQSAPLVRDFPASTPFLYLYHATQLFTRAPSRTQSSCAVLPSSDFGCTRTRTRTSTGPPLHPRLTAAQALGGRAVQDAKALQAALQSNNVPQAKSSYVAAVASLKTWCVAVGVAGQIAGL